MILYILYRLGVFLSLIFPTRVSYPAASFMADIYFFYSRKDRDKVVSNLKVVMGESADDKLVHKTARGVFRNFAKYLVDFFRFGRLDKNYLDKYVKVSGTENIDEALSHGRGAIILSAHIGNWELGGAVVSSLGYPISAVVLTHKNKLINDFFTNQRMLFKMRPIEMGASLKACYRALRNNELLALLGDRDFSRNGLEVDFFGKKTRMPKGHAVFSCRLGAPIIHAFFVRQPDDTFMIHFDKPVRSRTGVDEETAVAELIGISLRAMESCIKKHPAQWFAFRKIWDLDDKERMCADTII